MRMNKITSLMALLLFTLAATAHAQRTQDPKLEPGRNQLAQFEAAEETEYILGAGDHIVLDVDGRPELSGTHLLGPDGKITLPIAGEISLDGLTRINAAVVIANALQPYYKNLSITVRVTDYLSNKVTVLGSVEHPGSILFESTPTLLDAVSRAGYLGTAGGPRNLPETCIIYRGESQSVTVNLAEMIANGDPLANLRLKKNDVIFMPAPKQKFVSVMGAVVHPGAISLESGDTLALVLGEAGGPLQEASKTNMVVVDGTTGRQRIVSLDDVLNPSRTAEIRLHSGDIVYVPRSNMAKLGFVLEKFNPIFSAAGISGFILH